MASKGFFAPGRPAPTTKTDKKKKIVEIAAELKAGFKLVREEAAEANLNPLDSKAWMNLRTKHRDLNNDISTIERLRVENSDTEKAVEMRIEDCSIIRQLVPITKTEPREFPKKAAEAAIRVIVSNADGLNILRKNDVNGSVKWLADTIDTALRTNNTKAITNAQNIFDVQISTMKTNYENALAAAQKEFNDRMTEMGTKHEKALMAAEAKNQEVEESRDEETERVREVEASLKLRISTMQIEHNQALEARLAKYNVLVEEFEERVEEYEEKVEKSRERVVEIEEKLNEQEIARKLKEEEYTRYRAAVDKYQLEQSAELDRAINREGILSGEKGEVEKVLASRTFELGGERARAKELANTNKQLEHQLRVMDVDMEVEKSSVERLSKKIAELNQYIDTLESKQEKLVDSHRKDWITMGNWCHEAQKGRSDALGRLRSTNKAYIEEVATMTNNYNLKIRDFEDMEARLHGLEGQIEQRDLELLSAITWITENGERPIDIQQVNATSSLAANLLYEWTKSPFSNFTSNTNASSFQTGTTTLLVDSEKLIVFQQQPLVLCIVNRTAIKHILLTRDESTCMMKEIEGYEKIFPIVVKGEESVKFDLWLRLNVWNANKPSRTHLGDLLARMVREYGF